MARVQASTINEREAEEQTLEFLRRHIPKGQSPMRGNSICQDRRFLARCMPNWRPIFITAINVSTIKELCLKAGTGNEKF